MNTLQARPHAFTISTRKRSVARDSGFSDSGCNFTVRVDGKVEGQIASGEIVTIETSAGQHKVSVGTGSYSSGAVSSTLCSNLTSSLMVEVKDKPVAFRLGYGSNSQLFFEQAE